MTTIRALVVGVDPGVHTGLSVWNKLDRRLHMVTSMGIIEAQRTVKTMWEFGSLRSVVYEDARLRKWFAEKGREALMGAGSIRRESAIWAEFLGTMPGLPYTAVSPQNKGRKLDAAAFKRLTGWDGRTNEHGRDAAMLCFGL